MGRMLPTMAATFRQTVSPGFWHTIAYSLQVLRIVWNWIETTGFPPPRWLQVVSVTLGDVS